jgi:hypothetical protein
MYKLCNQKNIVERVLDVFDQKLNNKNATISIANYKRLFGNRKLSKFCNRTKHDYI